MLGVMFLLTIGLCGGSGSGKGAVCDAFRACGIPSVDTDKVYHMLTSAPSDCLDELVSVFGVGILTDGILDRRKLADIVFNPDGGEKARARLNSIAHKHILARTRGMAAEFYNAGARAVVIDAPLLFESGFDRECDVTVAVIADAEKRVERITARDGISRDAALRRIASQIADSDLISRADHVIYNNGSFDELSCAVNALVRELLKNDY